MSTEVAVAIGVGAVVCGLAAITLLGILKDRFRKCPACSRAGLRRVQVELVMYEDSDGSEFERESEYYFCTGCSFVFVNRNIGAGLERPNEQEKLQVLATLQRNQAP